MLKIAFAQALLRKMHTKQAGLGTTAVIGATALGGAHIIGKGIQKSHEYKAGFQPGGGHQQ